MGFSLPQTVIKILLAHVAQHILLVYQYDFKTAFLNSLVDEEEQIYVEQPHGFEVNEVNGVRGKYVCKLKKGLYGLHMFTSATATGYIFSFGLSRRRHDPPFKPGGSVGALVGRLGFRAGFARTRARGRGRGSVGAA